MQALSLEFEMVTLKFYETLYAEPKSVVCKRASYSHEFS